MRSTRLQPMQQRTLLAIREGSGPHTAVTNVTKLAACSRQSCGSMESISMQVFTTIFLAQTLRANVECVQETPGLDQNLPGAVEFKDALRKRIVMLETRGFFESDQPDE